MRKRRGTVRFFACWQADKDLERGSFREWKLVAGIKPITTQSMRGEEVLEPWLII